MQWHQKQLSGLVTLTSVYEHTLQEQLTYSICDFWLIIILFKVIPLYFYIYTMLCIVLVIVDSYVDLC